MTREELEQVIYERTRYFVEERVLDCILELIAAEREAIFERCEELRKAYEDAGYDVPLTLTQLIKYIRARGSK
jgi:hypothetical protein